MYAIFEDGSRQYKVSEGQLVTVDYREVEPGTRIEFNPSAALSQRRRFPGRKARYRGPARPGRGGRSSRRPSCTSSTSAAVRTIAGCCGHRQHYLRLRVKAHPAARRRSTPATTTARLPPAPRPARRRQQCNIVRYLDLQHVDVSRKPDVEVRSTSGLRLDARLDPDILQRFRFDPFSCLLYNFRSVHRFPQGRGDTKVRPFRWTERSMGKEA